jgi:tripartite-type tricarboxylate transporter receptor subunit TctC
MPDVPTLAETIAPGFDTSTWFGLYGPPGLSPVMVARLETALEGFAADPVIRARMAHQAFEPATATPAALAALQTRDTENWARVIRAARITVE